MQSSDTIQIFIPYVGGVELLRNAVATIIKQDYVEWELTVVDNYLGNHDAKIALADFNDSRVRVIEISERLSMVANWNLCLDLAVTPLTVLCHSDDEWEPNLLSTIVALKRKHPTAAAFTTGGYAIGPTGTPKLSLAEWRKSRISQRLAPDGLICGISGIAVLARGNFLFCSTFFFNNSIPFNYRFDANYRFVPDYRMAMQILIDGDCIAYAPEKLCRYRRHEKQATANLEKNSLRFEEEIEFYNWLTDLAITHSWQDVVKISRTRFNLRIHMLLFAFKNLFSGHFSMAFRYWKMSLRTG